MNPELILPVISVASFIFGVVGLALCIDYYVERRFGIHAEDWK